MVKKGLIYIYIFNLNLSRIKKNYKYFKLIRNNY